MRNDLQFLYEGTEAETVKVKDRCGKFLQRQILSGVK